jgi:hypothetical protein
MPCLNFVKSLANSFVKNRYGSELEAYITSKNPKNLADVEQYTLEFERKIADQTFK